jgi:RNA polymerase sigma-32 factor
MQDYVLRNWSIVRTGTTAAQKSLFFNFRRLRARIEDATGSRLGDEGRETIASQLKVNIAEVESMETRLGAHDQSLNAPLTETSEDDWQDFLPDHRPNPEVVAIGMRDGETRSRWLAEALGELSPREQTIIRKRRLTDEGATLEELGRALGVSKERVRQLESRALNKLRDSISRHVESPRDLLLEN